MLGFMRCRPRNDPADRAIPDRMHHARSRAAPAIDGCHCAIDSVAHPCDEFGLHVLKTLNFHSAYLLDERRKTKDERHALGSSSLVAATVSSISYTSTCSRTRSRSWCRWKSTLAGGRGVLFMIRSAAFSAIM